MKFIFLIVAELPAYGKKDMGFQNCPYILYNGFVNVVSSFFLVIKYCFSLTIFTLY